MRCKLCRRSSSGDLCTKHQKEYIWDADINAFRLRKRGTGSRYTPKLFHKTETKLVKLLEDFYGPENVVSGVRPLWALSPKQVPYEFDAYIKNIDVFVEYNSSIHYKFTKLFHRTRKNFLRQLDRDNRKAAIAKAEGKCLVVITEADPLFNDYIIPKIEAQRVQFHSS